MDVIAAISLAVAAVAVALTVTAAIRLRRRSAALAGALAAAGLEAHAPDDLAAAVGRLLSGQRATDEARARLAGTVSAASIGIIATDVSGAVRVANEAAARYLGARHGEAVAEVRIREAITSAITDGEAVTRDVTMYTPVRRALLVVAVPLVDDGRLLGAAAYVHDVTEERRVEAMRRDFIANASHELRTPIGALSVLAETLADRRGDPEVLDELSGLIVNEATRLATLLDDLLDLSRAEASPAPFAPVDLEAVIADVAPGLTARAEEYGVGLAIAPVPEGAVVNGDRRQLRSLVMNLVDNAVKYSDSSGNGARPHVTVQVVVDGDRVGIEIRDEGIGIPEAHRDRIFERFYRVDRARSRETGGTGLGLSIVRNVAANHGGTVAVESTVGEGSLFTVTLPRWEDA